MNYLIINLLYNCVVVVSTLFAGTGLAVFFVSLIYDSNTLEDDEKEEQELSLYQKVSLYEQKYFNDFYELEESKLSETELKELFNKNIEDETPMGNVIMTYNHETESFWYYCDSKTLTYKTLDALAQLFAIKHDCKQICVNYKDEWEKGKENIIKQKLTNEKSEKNSSDEESHEESDEENEEQKKSVFAKFKSYNIVSNRAKTDNKENKTSNKYYICTEKSNRFTHKGRLDEFIEKSVKSKPKNNISFKDFKTTKQIDNCST